MLSNMVSPPSQIVVRKSMVSIGDLIVKLLSSFFFFDGCFWFNIWFFFSSTHSLTALVGFFGIGMFGVCCSVQNLLWQINIIVINADFTEGFEDVRISMFGVYCSVVNKLFRYP